MGKSKLAQHVATSTLSKSEKKALQKINYSGPPALPFEELMELYGPHKMLYLEEILQNKTTWSVVYQNLWDLCKWGFEYEEVRTRIIHFKIRKSDKTKPYSLQMRHFLSNMILWYAFAATDSVDIMDESYIYNFIDKPIEAINDFIDEKYVRQIEVDSDTMSAIIDEIIFNITAVAKYISIIAGGGLSVYNICKTAEKHPRIVEIMTEKPNPEWQPSEIEAFFKERTNELADIIRNSDCDLAPIFKAGKIMSMGQFQEVMVGVGFKPDLDGHVIPYMINHNIFVDGMITPADFLIDAQAARKATIDSKINMKDPGTYAKRVANSAAHVLLRTDYEMCDSTRTLQYTIIDQQWLTALNGRYYYDDQDGNKMKCVDRFKDQHLIGRTLQFRSPCTCNSDNGMVCMYCYGKLFSNNQNLASAGAYAGIVETEPLKQRTLKSKHINQTNSESIAFNEEFNRDFEFISSDIVLKDDTSTDQDQYLLIDKIFKEEDSDDNVQYYCTDYKVVDARSNVIYNVVPDHEIKLYFSDSLKALIKRSKSTKQLLVAFDDIDATDSIFNVSVSSEDSIDSTARIKALVNTKAATANTTIDELCQNMLANKFESDIRIDAVHDEMIIRGLIRKRSDIYSFPDFGPTGDHDDYQILSINDSLFNSASPIDSMRQTNLRKQLLDPRFYTKTEPSSIDPLFATNLADVLPDDHPTLDRKDRFDRF